MAQIDKSPEKKKLLNYKSRKKALITLAVILTSILFFFLLYKLTDVRSAISFMMGKIAPVLYGIAIAYLLNPLVERIRKPLNRFFGKYMKNQKRAAKTAKGISITTAVVFALVAVSVLLWLIIPQLFESISKLIESMPGYIKSVMNWYDTTIKS